MARTRVKMNSAGVRDVFDQWARGDGLARGRRVADAMSGGAPVESGTLAASHEVWVEDNPSRPVVRVGSDLDYALPIAVATGYMARALDAAGGA